MANMSSMDEKVYYILLCDVVGRRRRHSNDKDPFEDVSLPAGTVMTHVGVVENSYARGSQETTPTYLIIVQNLDKNPVEANCEASEIQRVTDKRLDLLLPIVSCSKRLEVFLDDKWIDEGLGIKVNDSVDINVTLHNQTFTVLGQVRYKGHIDGELGVYFGVELAAPTGIGTTDGTRDGHAYFKCAQNCGLFVALNDIRLHRSTSSPPISSTHGTSIDIPSPMERAQPQGSSLESGPTAQPITVSNLAIGDRVVWMSDYGSEFGTVRWIGLLEGREYRTLDDVTVGVEFDNPVGTGTGRHKNQRLFNTPQGHASLMPMIGLLKADDHKAARSNNNAPPRGSTSDPDTYVSHGEKLRQYETMRHQLHSPKLARSPPSSEPDDLPVPKSLSGTLHPQVLESGLEVGSVAQVALNPETAYGVIRWIGIFEDMPLKVIAGLEMEHESSAGTDGVFRRVRLFTCPPKKGLFVPLKTCFKDARFMDAPLSISTSRDFGGLETPNIGGNIRPPDYAVSMRDICGRNKGIQGHHNSCYLDATLVSMFYFTVVFDSVFYRNRRHTDIPEYTLVQKTLKEGIVNPLRKNFYVRADKVMSFRQLLDELGSVSGMMSEEKDPEEFLNLFLSHIMKADPLIKLTSGAECFYFQLFFDKDDRLTQPTTQQLVELTFHQSNHKLSQVPACMIIQMPRHGKDYRMYSRIVPSLELDITDVLDNVPRECAICGELAEYECKECYGQHSTYPNLSLIAFCDGCNSTNHKHAIRAHHRQQPIKLPKSFTRYYQRCMNEKGTYEIPRQKMELTAVMCIATSHYVTFVKCGQGPDAPWIFFDSMADRVGGQTGYNVPQVTPVNNLVYWLSEDGQKSISETNDRDLPEYLRRLVCDSYMCFYQNYDVALFV